MTTPQQGSEKTAAVFFAGFLTLALGGAGLLIAALAVGAERAWNGGRVEGNRARERSGSWLDNQRAWLDQDHQRRTARSKAYGDWLRSGADPATAPVKPSWWHRIGASARRGVAHAAVAGNDFRTGFRDGWTAGQRVRRGGGRFRDIAAARPRPAVDESAPTGSDDTPTLDNTPTLDDLKGPRPEATDAKSEPAPAPNPTSGPDSDNDAGSSAAPERRLDWLASPESRRRPDEFDAAYKTRLDAKFDELATTPAGDQEPTDQRAHTTGGDTMTATTTTTKSAPTGESNAAVLRALLMGIEGTLAEVSDLTDDLSKRRDKLNNEVQRAEEFATVTGQSAQARHALDEAKALSASMGDHLGSFSDGAVGAQEQMNQASDGLKVAEQADDDLRAAGADGRAVAPAGTHA